MYVSFFCKYQKKERRKVRPYMSVLRVLICALVDLQKKKVYCRMELDITSIHIYMIIKIHPPQSWHVMKVGRRQKNPLDAKNNGCGKRVRGLALHTPLQDSHLWDTWLLAGSHFPVLSSSFVKILETKPTDHLEIRLYKKY